MCANCGFPAAPGHWTEAGIDKTVDRLQSRHRRAAILKNALKSHGLTAHDDGATPGIAISTMTGNLEIAEDLADVWRIAERLSGRPVDPLSSQFLCDEADAGGGPTGTGNGR
jgi:hypothetical protein